MSGVARHHSDWMSLVEISGPFLTLPVLTRVFPQGLPKLDTRKSGRLRAAHQEWAEAQDGRAKDADVVHAMWVQFALGELLEFDSHVLWDESRLPPGLEVHVAELHETIRPTQVVVEPTGRLNAGTPRLLILAFPPDQDLEGAVPDTRWAASPLARMAHLCRSTGVRLGLVTNGDRWTLVDAPVDQTVGYASWYASLWLQEPATLAAFEALLGVRRFFAVAETDTLGQMLDDSVAYQQEVTDQLGYQVRRAVEVLVQALDRADLDRQRQLLKDVTPERLYEAALTIMMRLVFLFCAEERGLLLLGDLTYDTNYAVSTIRAQLREEADRVGVEVLERRQDAWARLLATFRAVFGGIDHEALRLPALGGSLFDPDRFPFLEGRQAGSTWLETPAAPLPIDNRTVLHLLDSLQLLRMKGTAGPAEARKLSYRALDIEQIGHVYEGLLDHMAVRVEADTLGLIGSKDKEPELSIEALDRQRRRGRDALIDFLKEQTGRSVAALRKALDSDIDEDSEHRLLVASGNDEVFVKRTRPFHALIRNDVWGYPQVYKAGSFMVTGGSERRQTGTHYTPKSLTEKIVAETLEPLVYIGPAQGKARNEWAIRTPAELMDLKICDMAMGSAAFLVQVCRWLGERLVESWEESVRSGGFVSADGDVHLANGAVDLLPTDREERLSLARRLIAERCVYGVDINPMAVDLAKLSLWLVTLAKGRPFGFLDHNLRTGDSLFGVARLDQLENFHLDPKRGKVLHHSLFDPLHAIRTAVSKALELRSRLRAVQILDIEDVRAMSRLDDEAKSALEQPELAADLLMGAAISTAGKRQEEFDDLIADIGQRVSSWLENGKFEGFTIRDEARHLLDYGCPERLRPRRPFHWAVEFPEVFSRSRPGFDAIIGNPPFMGGQKLTGNLGTAYREFLVFRMANGARGSADLVAYFFLRAFELIRMEGDFGLLAVNTIAEGDTRQVGIERLAQHGAVIFAAHPNEPWPGRAAVVTSRVHVHKGDWGGPCMYMGHPVSRISAFLTDRDEWTPMRLRPNEGKAFIGSYVLGMGFVVGETEALAMIQRDPRNRDVLYPYLNGEDLNSSPEQKPSRWVINFWDWPEARARTYPEPFEIVKTNVRMERQRLNVAHAAGRRRKQFWWQYASDAKSLYHAIGRGAGFEKHPAGWDPEQPRLPRVLVIARVSKTGAFAFVPNCYVPSDATVVFATDSYAMFALLQSSIHVAYSWQHSSKLKGDLRYAPTDCFATFPFPEDGIEVLSMHDLGCEFYAQREAMMHSKQIGLTGLYGSFHDSTNTQTDISALRDLHRQLDRAVVEAFGWSDIDLAHDFHSVSYLPEKDNIRFTISERARCIVLSRLAELNRKRYTEDCETGLDGTARSEVTIGESDDHCVDTRRAVKRANRKDLNQPELSFTAAPKAPVRPGFVTDGQDIVTESIRQWLSVNSGWHGREEILRGAQVDSALWATAIANLLSRGAVARQGERRGTKYKAK